MSLQRALLPLLAALPVWACASTGGTAPSRAGEDVRILGTDGSVPAMLMDGSLRIGSGAEAIAGELEAPVGAVWNALRATYEAMEIPIGTFQPAQGKLASPRFRARRLAGQQMSRWIDCGNGTTGARADTQDVFVTLSHVVETGTAGRTRLGTALSAEARPRGYSGNDVPCRSFGRFEALLLEEVRRRATP